MGEKREGYNLNPKVSSFSIAAAEAMKRFQVAFLLEVLCYYFSSWTGGVWVLTEGYEDWEATFMVVWSYNISSVW
ncbi:hypothetical protein LOK49_LG12G02362 [Camellia lanceoleosa]|uniref:Uncharacterized protein n=1 Tax=Camellia lanceoleosa TaxID=1840588 RepID=A0ACC0FVW0_9ERIC|nr:hypothetical protein LOK49_LG12G02362 [Camellia lanceoleosa]